ncbi:MAG: thiolase family protein, partial [candidate division Zixibacteria bacterium]|nr:thiolase family protein [candidate division Zixibacteria bacterium]
EKRLTSEIVAVEQTDRKGNTTRIETDDHVVADTTVEKLSQLRPAFGGESMVTAGNASGIVDGAAVLVLASARHVRASGKTPIGRLVSWGVVGVEPEIMGIGPAPALRVALDRAGLPLGDIDLFEINEAFAGQYLAVEKELDLDRDRVNVNGGAIALGHPLGATGARLVLTLLYELRRRGKRYGAAAACIGGGQGIAAVVEAERA